jgi:hypothetical protein
MKKSITGLFLSVLACCALLVSGSQGHAATWQDNYAAQNAANLANPIGGWNILSDYYQASTTTNYLLDGLSIEWDYYSIHDDNGNFTGIVGYLVCDPNGKLNGSSSSLAPGLKLMPSGGNLAFNGEFKDGSKNANYINFPIGNFQASKYERSWSASLSSGTWGRETPVAANADGVPEMHLEGVTPDYAWDLRVTQAWPERDALANRQPKWEVGNDLNPLLIGVEHWTVNMIWPTTLIKGTVTNRKTGITYPINGHGYRENSFGRWAFCFGGWDFYFVSDMAQKIQIGFQTYHFDTSDLDFMDVDFIDPATNQAVGLRFRGDAGELGWDHTQWNWSTSAKQCTPKNAHIIGKKSGYIVDVTATINNDYYAMLSSVTPLTSIFAINCLFPKFSGTIKRTNGQVLYTFTNIQGGGEFALPRSVMDNSFAYLFSPLINYQFYQLFKNPFPN